jgi:hypothetical protein
MAIVNQNFKREQFLDRLSGRDGSKKTVEVASGSIHSLAHSNVGARRRTEFYQAFPRPRIYNETREIFAGA